MVTREFVWICGNKKQFNNKYITMVTNHDVFV